MTTKTTQTTRVKKVAASAALALTAMLALSACSGGGDEAAAGDNGGGGNASAAEGSAEVYITQEDFNGDYEVYDLLVINEGEVTKAQLRSPRGQGGCDTYERFVSDAKKGTVDQDYQPAYGNESFKGHGHLDAAGDTVEWDHHDSEPLARDTPGKDRITIGEDDVYVSIADPAAAKRVESQFCSAD